MSNTIDQKVVEMRFDNKHFENNVQTSMKTIDNLKQGLNFTGAVKGLDGINDAVRYVNLSGITNAVETVHAKFSALQVMAVTALTNITNSAVNAGKKLISSLTIDPIMAGFHEYETQMNSVQTILANTQSRQKAVSKEVSGAVKEEAAAVAESTKQANKASLDNLRDSHKEKIKEYEKIADAEIDILEEKHEKETEALEDSLKAEKDMLNEAHREKLALYHEEYMANLKIIDEERYNKIKAIDDQIAAINNRTKAEDKNIKQEKQQERLSELRVKVNTAEDIEDRMEAQKRLADYEKEIARDRLIEQREASIDKLEQGKESVEKEYDLAVEKLKTEYDEKIIQENKLYELSSETLKKEQADREKAFRKAYQVERELLTEKQSVEKEAIRELQEDEIDALNRVHDVAMKNIATRQAAASVGTQEFETTKGSTLQDVNRALDELNAYADKTIYNFTEMTRNIGTFTAAGVDLDTSVQAIKGIANLAAVSGSTSQQASTAMYQLSQALASGTVKLMDWNSVTNAGMGGQVFQDSLKETARVHGIAIDQMVAENGSFRETLQNGWLSADILTETLAKFTGDLSEAQLKEMGYTEEQIVEIIKLGEMANDAATKVKTFTQLQDTLKEAAQSGWTKSWQIILGDFNEAKNLFTEISDIVGKILGDSADARNAFLGGGLSSGWKQFLNQGIADEEGLKEAIIATAKETNPEIEQMIKDAGSFEESLKSGWLTADIMSTSLENLTAKTRGLSDEQLEAQGYTRAQIDSLEELNAEVQKGSVSTQEFTDKMTEASGRENIIEGLLSVFRGLVNIFKMVKTAFTDIFPPATSDNLYTFTERIKNIGASFEAFSSRLSNLKVLLSGAETPFNNLRRTVKGFFAAISIVVEIFKALFKAISPATGTLGDLAKKILSVTAGWGDWLVKLNETIKTTDIFSKAIEKVINFVKDGIDKVKELFSKFITLIKENITFPGLDLFHSFLERIHERMSQVGDAATSMKSIVVVAIEAIGSSLVTSNFFKLLSSVWDLIKGITVGIARVLGQITTGLIDKLGNANFDGILDLLSGVSIGAIALAISNFLGSFTKSFTGLKDMLDGVAGILDGVRGSLEAFQTQLKAAALVKIAIAVALLAASILVISLIDSDKLAAALAAITILFADLMGSMAVLTKGIGGAKGVTKAILSMIGISVAVFILASALKKIGELGPEQIAAGIAGITALVGIVISSAKIMGSGGATIIKGSLQMVIFAAAISILADVAKELASLSWEELAKGLAGVGILMAEVSLFLNTAKFSKGSMSTAIGIVMLSAAIKILASACEDFSEMSWEELAKGLSSIGVLLLEIVAFTKLVGDPKHIISIGVALIAVGASMKIFASAIRDLADMTWEELARGLAGMAGALLAVTLALKFMPKNMIGTGIGLIAVSAALVIMASALGTMGDMTWEEIGKGLVVLGGSMLILAIGLNAMNGTLAGAAALLVAVAALAVLTPVLSILGAMSWEAIIKGLVALAGAFAVIGLAGLLLTPVVPAILALAGAFALIGLSVLLVGVGLLAAGAGLSALAIGFTALAAAGIAGATSFVAALTIVVTGMANLIPLLLEKVAEGIIAFWRVISESMPEIGKAVKAVVLMLIDVLVECLPAIVEGVLVLLESLMAAVVNHAPKIIDLLYQFVIKVLEGIANNLPDLIKAGVKVLMALFSGIIDALGGMDFETIVKGLAGIGLFAGIMLALSAVAALIPGAMVGVLGIGLIIAELAIVLAAIGALSKIPGLTWLIGEGAKLMEAIGNAIGSFIGGIVGGVMSSISAQFPKIGTDLSAFMTNIQPFIEGASKITPSMMDGVGALVGVILALTAANILNGLTSWFTGGSSMEDFGKELAAFGPYFNIYYESIKNIKGSVVLASANAAKALGEMVGNLPNKGGVAGWFAGENSLSDFAEELVDFGPKLKEYADSVDGLDADVVLNSANAAKALFELAKNLPNSGGVVGWFVGENSLSAFADELVLFGPSLKKYAESITGLNPDVITNSTNAALALSELATKLPNAGGMVSWFTGDNDIADFGKSLMSFGESFAAYGVSISNIKPDVVTSTTNSAKAVLELQKSLPKSNSVFSDQMSMSEFGKGLSAFGKHFSDYYSNISGISTSKLSAVIDETGDLVSVIQGMSGIKIIGVNTFGEALKKLGKMGVDEFVKAFTDAYSSIKAAASGMLDDFIEGVDSHKKTFLTNFTKLVTSITDTLTSSESKGKLKDSAKTLLDSFTEATKEDKRAKGTTPESGFINMIGRVKVAIEGRKSDFETAGKTLMNGLISGANSKDIDNPGSSKGKTSLALAFHNLIIGVINEINNGVWGGKTLAGNFKDSGTNMAQGFSDGIASKYKDVALSAVKMAAIASKAVSLVLEEKSPSKVFYRIGAYAVKGFTNALDDSTRKTYVSGYDMAESAKKGLSQAIAKMSGIITSDIDTQPTIRPVMDLTEIQNGTNQLYRMMQGVDGYAVSGSVGIANRTAASMSPSLGSKSVDNNSATIDFLKKAVKELINNPSKIENTFNITGDNPDDIAEKVSQKIQHQVERRDASWA